MPLSPAASPLSCFHGVAPSSPGPRSRVRCVCLWGSTQRQGQARPPVLETCFLVPHFRLSALLQKRLPSPASRPPSPLPGPQPRGRVFAPWGLPSQLRARLAARWPQRLPRVCLPAHSVLAGAQLAVARLLALRPLWQGRLCHRFTGGRDPSSRIQTRQAQGRWPATPPMSSRTRPASGAVVGAASADQSLGRK